MEVDNDDALGLETDSSATASGTATPIYRGLKGGARFDMTPLTAHHHDNDSNYPSPAGEEDEGTWSEDIDSPPASTTPTWEESYTTLRRTLSYKTLRDLELKHVQKQIWRRQGEPRKRPKDLEQLAIYAFTGAARKFCYPHNFAKLQRAEYMHLRRVCYWLFSEKRCQSCHSLNPLDSKTASVPHFQGKPVALNNRANTLYTLESTNGVSSFMPCLAKKHFDLEA